MMIDCSCRTASSTYFFLFYCYCCCCGCGHSGGSGGGCGGGGGGGGGLGGCLGGFSFASCTACIFIGGGGAKTTGFGAVVVVAGVATVTVAIAFKVGGVAGAVCVDDGGTTGGNNACGMLLNVFAGVWLCCIGGMVIYKGFGRKQTDMGMLLFISKPGQQ
uniref:Uncharacterized protein n=1 Tax=Glossina austeni TaxID=7395 RepID=A0A1A9VP12_GLOAU